MRLKLRNHTNSRDLGSVSERLDSNSGDTRCHSLCTILFALSVQSASNFIKFWILKKPLSKVNAFKIICRPFEVTKLQEGTSIEEGR
jgi:hypothetical protein